ncbi:hypothetical protein BJV74DRAFT_861946 [Russula compacta]|nr:hypothetical protein BJV74DRAFT_861946 [Russula compacta]
MQHPSPNIRTGGVGLQRTTIKDVNDDILVEIFDACRIDNVNPNQYPRRWWYKLAQVCQTWRRVIFASPIRLGLTLICTSRTHVADLLANSPPLPLIIIWGKPEPLVTEDGIENVCLALQHRDRVCRITLQISNSSVLKVFPFLEGTFPALETLELYGPSSEYVRVRLPSTFEAPNLRHLHLSDFTLAYRPSPPTPATFPASLVTFSLGEITPSIPVSPEFFAECLSLMPHLKSLNIGYLFPVEETRDNAPDQQVSHPPILTNLEELQFQGVYSYFECLAAQICAPLLKKLSITFSNSNEPRNAGFPHLSQLIDGAPNLKFHFARVRFKDGVSIVLDHNELWTGRGALELRFNVFLGMESQIALVARVWDKLASTLSTVESLLLESAEGYLSTSHSRWHKESLDATCCELLRHFDNVKTLRLAHRFVEELDRSLRPDRKGKVLTLLPRLQEIVCYGPDKEFSAFVEARRLAGQPVQVVSGPKNRLWLV